ncbi:MAG: MFS transporter [Pseudonocardiaceae bacterium]
MGAIVEARTSPMNGTRQALVVLLASGTLVIMAGAAISPVLTLIRDQFHLSAGVAGLVVTTHALLIAVSGPLVGSLIDRLGTKPVLVGGLAAYAVFGSIGALATSFPMLLGSRILFGVAAAGVLNGSTVSMLNLWQGRQRDVVMGYWATSNSGGGVFWPLVAGLLGGLGWRGPFAVYLVALPIAAAAIWLMPESTPATHPGGAGPVAAKPTMREVLSSAPVLPWLYAFVFIVQLQLYTIVVFVPQRLAELGVVKPFVVSIAIALVNVAAGLVGLTYGRLRRVLSFRQLFLIGSVVPVLAFAVLSVASKTWLILLGTPLFGLTIPLVLASAPALLGRQAIHPRARGRATSYQSSMMLLGQFSSPLLLGLLVSPFGLRAAFVAVAVVGVVEAIAVATAFRPDRTQPAVATKQPPRADAPDDDQDRKE